MCVCVHARICSYFFHFKDMALNRNEYKMILISNIFCFTKQEAAVNICLNSYDLLELKVKELLALLCSLRLL